MKRLILAFSWVFKSVKFNNKEEYLKHKDKSPAKINSIALYSKILKLIIKKSKCLKIIIENTTKASLKPKRSRLPDNKSFTNVSARLIKSVRPL